jgi:hypothetical protein
LVLGLIALIYLLNMLGATGFPHVSITR